MEDLVRLHLDAIARGVQQVAVPLAKGVVDLDDDGAQAAVGAVAVPETHGLEGVAPHARVAVQPDLARRVVNALGLQQAIEPGQGAALRGRAAIAVVGVVKAQGTAPVDGQCLGCFGQAAHGQHEKAGGVDKGMVPGAQPGVAHLAKTDQRAVGLHAASASGPGSVARSCWAAAKPDLRPSSWKP
jgi:hypothetical protein